MCVCVSARVCVCVSACVRRCVWTVGECICDVCERMFCMRIGVVVDFLGECATTQILPLCKFVCGAFLYYY